MNELLNAMSTDMGISPYHGESDNSFVYRLCFSALGQWCLHTGQNLSGKNIGTTKHNQTIVLNELLLRYSELFPTIADKFIDTNNLQLNFPVFIRRIYEETGYFLTDESNRNHLANYGRCMPIGNTALFFGIPNKPYVVNGLGVFCSPTTFGILPKIFLVRDDLTWEGYFQSQFDIIDYYNKDINMNELEFFNPLSSSVPSLSWERQMETACSVARKSELGPFYRVMRVKDIPVQFVDEPVEQQSDSFTSYEYRRLYFALKAHYNNPLKVTISKQDAEYSKIRVGGYLPNREYYFLLLLSWPENNVFNKVNFLIRNSFIPEVIATLMNIGIEVKGEDKNVQL